MKIYICGTTKVAGYLKDLIAGDQNVFSGFVSAGDAGENAIFRGWPVIDIKTLQECDYDICLHTEEEGHLPEDDRHLNIWDSYSVVSMGANPEYYVLRQKAKNDLTRGVDGVITGLSYIQKGTIIEKLSYPMAMCAGPRQDLFYDFFSLADAIKRNPIKLKFCILGLAPYSLRYDLSLSKNSYRSIYYFKEFGEWHHAGYPREQLERMMQVDSVLDTCCYSNWRDILFDVISEYDFSRRKEVFRFDELSEAEKQISLKKVYDLSNKPYPETVEENKMILEMYFKLCKNQGIKCLVVLPPFSAFFRTYFSKEYIEELRGVINEMKERYSFVFLDVYDDESFEKGGFYEDEDHLNVYGAEELTERINVALRQMA